MTEQSNPTPSKKSKEELFAEVLKRSQVSDRLNSYDFDVPFTEEETEEVQQEAQSEEPDEEVETTPEEVEAEAEEEEIESEPESEVEEEIEEEKEVPESKRSKAEKDFLKKQYQYQAELQKREEDLLEREREIALLRAEKEEALKSTRHHFNDATTTRMEQLNFLYKKALSEGDEELLLQVMDARDELKAEKRKVDELYSQRPEARHQDYNASDAPNPQPSPAVISATQKHRANVWHNSHPELVAGSSSYNPKLWESVKKFASDYNNDLVQEGNFGEIYSDNYIKLLDEHLKNEKSKFSPVIKQKITTVPAHAPVASAKGGGLRSPVKVAKKIALEPQHELLINYFMGDRRSTREEAEERTRAAIAKANKDIESGTLKVFS